MCFQDALERVIPLVCVGFAAHVGTKTPHTGPNAVGAAMRGHNTTMVVTEPVGIEVLALTGTPTALPNLPTGDLGREVRQITIRATDGPWEWRFAGVSSNYFWMDTGEILVYPIRDREQLEDFVFKSVTGTVDMRIIYEA